ncbi:hypothetical protein IW140_004088 [Coemansia sp. RSA 1813]|nr:hypothetical protein EV178_004124 [Coemansia sp. RSA 1646]KAJ1768965.1 hypothetical protein LPJ74_004451 [Coemansia sp. RSA 1843]KAJ2088328.1 hypothetical protein IW138_004305 [Coemansia sp. RSA 986]KAJ2213333.1 hypothetical protein EV179_003931 [Coemansia sp. RSA 487]KAJ2568182.1 hypothetical protein IW140_004088 [Coemansia sp. RSA 1813]
MAAVCTPETAASDSMAHYRVPQWTAAIEFPDKTVDAIAGIGQMKTQAGVPVPLDTKLRLLQSVRLASVPPALLTPTVLALYVNAESEASRRYVNGLIARLAKQSQHTAVLARLEGTATSSDTPLGAVDPFASPRHQTRTSDATALPPWYPDRSTHALVYVSDTRLVLHVLASHARHIEPLATAMAGCALRGESCQQNNVAAADLSPEHAFIERLERRRRAETNARFQRTLSAESMVLAPLAQHSDGSTLRRKRQQQRRSGVITMTDVERLATPELGDDEAVNGGTADSLGVEDSQIEAVNKRLAKQLIIAALKDRGIARNHPEFAALWSQIYRSLKFALRDNIARRRLSVRDLKAETIKHTAFYCTS